MGHLGLLCRLYLYLTLNVKNACFSIEKRNTRDWKRYTLNSFITVFVTALDLLVSAAFPCCYHTPFILLSSHRVDARRGNWNAKKENTWRRHVKIICYELLIFFCFIFPYFRLLSFLSSKKSFRRFGKKVVCKGRHLKAYYTTRGSTVRKFANSR